MSPPPWRSRRCSARNRAARTSASNIPIATTPIISSTAWRTIAETRRRRSATAMSLLRGRSRPSASMAEPRHERDHHARGAALSSRDRQRAVFPALHGTLPGRLGGARRAQSHQGPSRRHAVVPLVLPHGGVRQLRHDDQRRAETVLPHLPARLPRRRDPCRAARPLPDRAGPRDRDGQLHGQALERETLADPETGQAAERRRIPAVARRTRGLPPIHPVYQLPVVLRRLPAMRPE